MLCQEVFCGRFACVMHNLHTRSSSSPGSGGKIELADASSARCFIALGQGFFNAPIGCRFVYVHTIDV